MAVFDVDTQKLVIRVVYDGAAFAGKTTNVRALCGHFTSKRRSELVVPDELAGRTLWFDWVQIEAGLAGGFPLSCQIVSVPGQAVLAPRRRHLVAAADVVVFVCNSSRESLAESRAALSQLLEVIAGREAPVPLVVQANKQDAADALDPAALIRELELPPSTPVAAARADDGVGVVETLVLAIRSAADHVQRAAPDAIDVRAPDSPEDVLAQLEEHAISDEELLQILVLSEPEAPTPDDRPSSDSAPPPPESGRISEAVPSAHSLDEPEAHEEHEERAVRELRELPTLPTADVPTGFIWPPLGRELLRAIDLERVVVRDDLVGRHGDADGSGKSDVIVCRAGDSCLKTSERRRHADAEQARANLMQLARAKMRLGDYLLPRTVVVVQRDQAQAHWVWTVTPWVQTLRASMRETSAARDEAGLTRALSHFAEASIEALALAARSDLVLDVHPSNYAVVDGRLRYLDDDVGFGRTLPAIGHTILRRADEYARFPAALRAFVVAVLDQARRTLATAEIDQLRLAVTDAIVHTPSAEQVRARLLSGLTELGGDATRAAG